MGQQRLALIFQSPFQVSLVEEAQPPPADGQLLVKTKLSAISPGTEMLVYRGQLPAEMTLDATIAGLNQVKTSYPLRYGYTSVGEVAEIGAGVEKSWLGRRVFAFQPHSSHFVCEPTQLLAIPDEIDDETALFYPNMETAVTFLLDGCPLLGEHVCVVGAGIVGLLTTHLLACFPLSSLTVIDPLSNRRQLALRLGAKEALAPEDLPGVSAFADLTFELSGNPAAVDTAIHATGFAGRVVIGSWYGQKRAPIDLGGYFHRSRIRLISSQVSTLPPERMARWDRQRRSQVVWEMLKGIDSNKLISHRFPITSVASAYQQVDQHAADSMQVLLQYDTDLY